MARRIGVYGGSFNPVHQAHLLLAEQAGEALDLELVIFVPARLPPHKDPVALASARDRLRMARLAVAGNPRFKVSDIELRRKGRSYTIDTANAFRKRFGARAELYFLIGADSIAELPTWRDAGDLAEICRIVAVSRPGAKLPKPAALAAVLGHEKARGILKGIIRMPYLDISASDIRARVSGGRSIRYLVPREVEDYIRRKRLYSHA